MAKVNPPESESASPVPPSAAVEQPKATPAPPAPSLPPLEELWGITVTPTTPQLAQQYGLESIASVVVTRVAPGSQAEAAGMRVGDAIIAAYHTAVTDVRRLRQIIASRKPGEIVPIRFERDVPGARYNDVKLRAPELKMSSE